MDDGRPLAAAGIARFELAPPRRFILPAILLLLSERPGYGYGLVPRLQGFGFGHVDRPAIYRALAQLEGDGLVAPNSQDPRAGQARRVFRVTPLGARVLRVWMGVVKEEHDNLGQVLRRYQATGTTDAVLAEVEGGWGADLGFGWSPVSPTSSARRRLTSLATGSGGGDSDEPGHRQAAATQRREFRLVPDRSVVLIEVRSSVGPLSFGVVGVTGVITAAVSGGLLCGDVPVGARLEIDVSELSSGNSVYDAELRRRIDARRHPNTVVELEECSRCGPQNLYRLRGEVTFHGVTRQAQGTVTLDAAGDRLVIAGEQVFDIRDFALPSPTVLMLRIYPDVRVHLHVEAESEEAG